MSSKNVPPNSYMNLFREIVYDKNQTPNPSLDVWDALVISPFDKRDLRLFQLHTIKIGDTWVKLARQYYSDERLWWVIPLFNDLEDPFISMDQQATDSGIEQLQILKPDKINQLLLLARQQKILNDRQNEKKRKEGSE